MPKSLYHAKPQSNSTPIRITDNFEEKFKKIIAPLLNICYKYNLSNYNDYDSYLYAQSNVCKCVAYVHRYVFWSNFVYFVSLISVCLFITVCFHCLPEIINKDEYL